MKFIPWFNQVRRHSGLSLGALFFFIGVPSLFANNLSISNVSLEDRNPSANTVAVEFDLSWENSWKSKINHDAIWLTLRLHNSSSTPAYKKLCEITASGTNPSGSSLGSNSNLEFYIPADKMGAFLRPSAYGVNTSLSSTNIRLTIDYSSCGFDDADNVTASIFSLEMVYVPEGSFYTGDYGTSSASLVQGSSDSDPWYISSESALAVSNPSSNGYRYVSQGHPNENATGSSFTIPSSFPKGFGPFYAMKYELSEGQWAEFVNSLPSQAARERHDLTDTTHKNVDSVLYRNTTSCSGNPLTCSSSRPARALSYLTWMDLAAFLDWAALRPMTELEYEKMARGPLLAQAGEFSWGTTDMTAVSGISAGDENGAETVVNAGANVHFNSIVLTGGDTGQGAEYSQGPLRGGMFATSSSDRASAGAGYYGAMELSGNVRERVVTIGNANGRSFTGIHGDGGLSEEAGYEGNANEASWPGLDAVTTRGVTGALGSGFKGGGWDDQVSGDRLRISDRNDAANASESAFNNAGGRGVRTVDSD